MVGLYKSAVLYHFNFVHLAIIMPVLHVQQRCHLDIADKLILMHYSL